MKITKSCVSSLHNRKTEEETSDLEEKLAEKEQQIEELENEKNALSKEVQNYEIYITNQVDQMKKLASYIDHLTQNSDKHCGGRRLKISTITNEIGESDNNRVKELEFKVNRYKMRLNAKDEHIKALQEKLEFERISREKLEEAFLRTAKIYEDLVYQNQGLGNMRYEYETCKVQCERLKVTCEELRYKARRVEELENELNYCNCYMRKQETKISKLCDDIDTKDSEMRMTISNLETDLEEYKEKFCKCQHEKSCLENQLETLEAQVEDYENQLNLKEENNKALLECLEKEKSEKTKLESSLATVIKTDQRLKEMLTRARHAMTTITQKLEECDIERLETQRDNQMKISELENQLAIANATIRKLKENLDKMKGIMDKNVALRTLSAQLHESANLQVAELKAANEDLSIRSQKMVEMYDYLKQVLYEKDKTFDDLRNHLVALRQQLDNEQKLREDTEIILEDMSEAKESELSEMKNLIEVLKNEICCLRCELEDLTSSTTAGQLKTRVKQLEDENKVLKSEKEKYCKCLGQILPGYINPVELKRLQNELIDLGEETELLRQELEKEKKLRLETVMHLQLKIEKQQEENKRIKEQVRESVDKKNRKDPTLPSVVFVEKKDKEGGGVEYKYLCGGKEGKTKNSEPEKHNNYMFDGKEEKTKNLEPEKHINYYKYECYLNSDGIEKKIFLGPLYTTYIGDNGEKKNFKIDPKTTLPRDELYIKERGRKLKIIWDPKTGPFKLNLEEDCVIKEKFLDALEEISLLQTDLAEDAVEIRSIDYKLTSALDEIQSLKEQLHSERCSIDLPRNEETEHENLTREIAKQKEEIAELLRKIQESSGEQEKVKIVIVEKEKQEVKDVLDDKKQEIERPKANELERRDNAEEVEKELKSLITKLKQEIEQLKAKNSELEKRNKAEKCEEELEKKKKDNEKLKSMIIELEKQLQTASNFQIKVPKTPVEVQTLMQHLKDSLELEQKRVIELEELWRDCENKGDKIKAKNEELMEENARLMEENLELKERKRLPSASVVYLNQLQEVDDNMKEWQGQINNTVSHVQQQVQEISEKVESHESQEIINRLIEEIETLKIELTEHMAGKKKVALTSDLQEKHIQELEHQVQQLNNTIFQLEEQNRKLLKSVEKGTDVAVEEEIKELRQQLKDFERKNANLQEDLQRLRHDRLSFVSEMVLNTTEETESPKTAELEEKLKQVVEENEALKQKLMRQPSKDSYDDKDRRVRELEDRLQQWQKDYDSDVGKLKNEMEKLILRGSLPPGCDAHEKMIKELQLNLENSHKEKESLEKKIIHYEAENENLVRMLNKCNDEASIGSGEDDKRVRDLVEHLRELQNKNESLKTRTIQLELENGRLKNDLGRIMGQGSKPFEKEMQRLRELERQTARSQVKYQNLKQRLIKLEVENRNLKKEYIDTLIAKEKIALKGKEQEQRLREANKLLRKTQDKKNALTMRVIQLQVANDELNKQLELGQRNTTHEDSVQIQNINKELITRNKQLEEQMEYLKQNIAEEDFEKFSEMEVSFTNVEGELNKLKEQQELRAKVDKLEMENVLMRKELEGVKMKEVGSSDTFASERPQTDEGNDFQLRAVELEIENEFLRNEIKNKENTVLEDGMVEKRINELEEEVNRLNEVNNSLKMKNVDMELDNEYMKNELNRISKVKQNLQSDVVDKDVEKQNHALKLKNDHLELEIKNLKNQLDNMGKQQIMLQSHIQEKRINEIERLLREYENMQQFVPKSPQRRLSKDDLGEVEDKMQEWRGEFMPQIKDLKKQLDKLLGKSKSATNLKQLEEELQQAEAKISELQAENLKLRVQIEIMGDEIPVNEAKLAEDIQEILKQFNSTQNMISADEKNKLEEKLKECQELNEILKNEKLSLDKHIQSKRIKDLEAQFRESASKTDIRLRSRRSLVFDVQDLRVKELEEELAECENKNESLQAEVDSLRKELVLTQTELQTKLQDCQQQNKTLKEEGERLRKINDLQQKLTKDLDNKYRECKANYDELQMKFERIPKDKTVSFHTLTGENIEELKAEVERLRKDSKRQRRMIHELEETLKKCREINKDLKRDNDEMHVMSQLMQNDYEKTSNHKLKQLKDAEKDKQNQNSDNNAPTDEEVLQNQIEFLKQKLGEMHDENTLLRVKRAKEIEERMIEAEMTEKSLEDLRIENEDLKAEIQNELAAKILLDDQINELKKKLELSEENNKTLKDEINFLTQERDSLLKENDNQKEEISELQKKIQCFGDVVSEKDELKLVISDLEEKIEDLTRLQLEVGKGDTDDKRSRKLEETLQKYQDNNESLKMRIRLLEEEKSSLKCELRARIEKEKKIPGSETQNRQIRKLEQTLQKYHDNNECLKKKIAKLEVDYQEKRVEELEDLVQKCQINNDGLKLVTAELESEIKYLRQELEVFSQKEKVEKPKKKQRKQEASIESEKKKLSQFMQQPPLYAMPVFIHQPFLTYGNYLSSPVESSNEIQELSHLVKKIQSSLEQRKRKVEKEKSGSEKTTSDEEEILEKTHDFNSQTVSSSSPVGNIETSSSVTVEKVTKQLQTKEKSGFCKEAHPVRKKCSMEDPLLR